MPRTVKYQIDDCFDCPFFEDVCTDELDSVCHYYPKTPNVFTYPDESEWFPDFCPLEKVVD